MARMATSCYVRTPKEKHEDYIPKEEFCDIPLEQRQSVIAMTNALARARIKRMIDGKK